MFFFVSYVVVVVAAIVSVLAMFEAEMLIECASLGVAHTIDGDGDIEKNLSHTRTTFMAGM